MRFRQKQVRQEKQASASCRAVEGCAWLQVVAGAAAVAGRVRKSAAEQLSDALAAGDSGGLGLRDIDRLLQVRTALAIGLGCKAREQLRSVVNARSTSGQLDVRGCGAGSHPGWS